MKIFADECVWQCTVEFLRADDHTVITAQEAGLCETEDEYLLDYAVSKNCVFITRDMDFSNILIYSPSTHLGLIVLRLKPKTIEAVHALLSLALSQFTQESIRKTLIIVDHKKFRLRHS